MNGTTRHKISEEIEGLNNIIIQLDLSGSYMKHSTQQQNTFFSNAHGMFSRIDHMLKATKENVSDFFFLKWVRVNQETKENNGGGLWEISWWISSSGVIPDGKSPNVPTTKK